MPVFYRILAPLYTMANLGYVGLGVMGGRMAERLIGKGHTVTGYNRTRTKAQWLIDKGLRWAETPRDVVASSDITFTMVTDSQALEAIADGPDGLLAGGTLRVVRVVVDADAQRHVGIGDRRGDDELRAAGDEVLGRLRAGAERYDDRR